MTVTSQSYAAYFSEFLSQECTRHIDLGGMSLHIKPIHSCLSCCYFLPHSCFPWPPSLLPWTHEDLGCYFQSTLPFLGVTNIFKLFILQYQFDFKNLPPLKVLEEFQCFLSSMANNYDYFSTLKCQLSYFSQACFLLSSKYTWLSQAIHLYA